MGGQERQGGGRERKERERKARGIVYGGKAVTTARGHLPTTSATLQPPSATTSVLAASGPLLGSHPSCAWHWAGQRSHRKEWHAIHPLQPCRRAYLSPLAMGKHGSNDGLGRPWKRVKSIPVGVS